MEATSAGVARAIRLAREGRPDALDELLESYRNYVRILAATSFPRDLRAKADPSDVVQDTLLKAHHGFHQFRGTTEPEWIAWLRQILVRTLLNLHRHYANDARSVDRERSFDDALSRSSSMLRDLVPSAGPTASQEAHRREIGVVVADGLAQLEPDDRAVVILRNLQELGWAEIGERMERSPDAARMLWARALQRLAGVLDEGSA